MSRDLSQKTLAILHAAVFTAQTVQPYIDEFIPEVQVVHLGDDTIQRDNLAAPVGTIPKVNFFKFTTYCHFMEEAGADLILLGCSTFNRAAELARPMINVPIMNIDRPMMDLAVQQGSRVGLIGTLPSTMPSSERLLREAARDAGKDVTVETALLSEAFKALRAGNTALHNEMLKEAIDDMSRRVDAIVLAQVSMSAIEKELGETRVPVYNSGRTAFAKVREVLEAME